MPSPPDPEGFNQPNPPPTDSPSGAGGSSGGGGRGAVTRVLHLAGSPTDEFYAELSLLYARGCLAALEGDGGFAHVIAYVEPGGSWRLPADLTAESIKAARPMPVADALRDLRADVALPQMFCRAGMTSYRGLLDVLGIPYVGNDAGVMALTADKALTRTLVAAAGVIVPTGELLRPGDRPTLPPPVVVKPVDADNSLGTTHVRDQQGYPPALEAAFAHSAAVLVEEFVPLGREVRCGILERGGELISLPLEEYAVDGIRAHADKLTDDVDFVAKGPDRSWIVDPADPVTARVQAAARACHRALGCRDYSLFDFRVDPAGRPFFLEAGLYCSFSETSVLATMAAAAGIPLPDLFTTAVTGALQR
jgi:D-alanine-D-alanine ligase